MLFRRRHFHVHFEFWIKFHWSLFLRVQLILSLVQIMAWRRPGDKPFYEPMMLSSLTHICITRPQWVNTLPPRRFKLYFRQLIFELTSVIDGKGSSCEIALRWMPLDLTQGKSTLVQVKALHQAITWANVDPDICHHMTSLGHNGVIQDISYVVFRILPQLAKENFTQDSNRITKFKIIYNQAIMWPRCSLVAKILSCD